MSSNFERENRTKMQDTGRFKMKQQQGSVTGRLLLAH